MRDTFFNVASKIGHSADFSYFFWESGTYLKSHCRTSFKIFRYKSELKYILKPEPFKQNGSHCEDPGGWRLVWWLQ